MVKSIFHAIQAFRRSNFDVIGQRLGFRLTRSISRLAFCCLLILGLNASYMPAVSAQAAQAAQAIQAVQAIAKPSYTITGKVIRVSDGDTLTIRNTENQKIRLASIDAPEKKSSSKRLGQPYSEPSRLFLSNLVAGQTITALCFETDRYGRHICDIPVGQTTANRLLVEAGLAWANQQAGGKYLRDKELLVLEQQAREAKRGLWVEPHAVAPWVWRIACWQKGQCS